MFISNNLEYLVYFDRGTRDEFGKKYGLNRGVISNYILGRSKPNLELLIKISEEFNITLDQLILTDLKESGALEEYSTVQKTYTKDSLTNGNNVTAESSTEIPKLNNKHIDINGYVVAVTDVAKEILYNEEKFFKDKGFKIWFNNHVNKGIIKFIEQHGGTTK